MVYGVGSGLCHYKLRFEEFGRDSDFEPFEEDGDVSLDVSTKPVSEVSDSDGDGPDFCKFPQSGDSGELPCWDEA